MKAVKELKHLLHNYMLNNVQDELVNTEDSSGILVVILVRC